MIDELRFSRELLSAMLSLRDGDFAVRLPSDMVGVDGKIADAFNEIVAANHKIAEELRRIGHVVGARPELRDEVRDAGVRVDELVERRIERAQRLDRLSFRRSSLANTQASSAGTSKRSSDGSSRAR